MGDSVSQVNVSQTLTVATGKHLRASVFLGWMTSSKEDSVASVPQIRRSSEFPMVSTGSPFRESAVRLRCESKRRIHSCGCSRSARFFRNISTARVPVDQFATPGLIKPISIRAAMASRCSNIQSSRYVATASTISTTPHPGRGIISADCGLAPVGNTVKSGFVSCNVIDPALWSSATLIRTTETSPESRSITSA
jgi:hypothetical protein